MRSIPSLSLSCRFSCRTSLLKFEWGKQRAIGCQIWAQHQKHVSPKLACLIFPSLIFQFQLKSSFRLNTKSNFFDVFQLLFKEAVEIMERAVGMSSLKNKQTCNIIMIFICIIIQSMQVKCLEKLKVFITTRMPLMALGKGKPNFLPTPHLIWCIDSQI